MERKINCITYLAIALLCLGLGIRAFYIEEFIMGIVFIIFCTVLTACAARA